MSAETIQNLVNNIASKSLTLPEFQREYVWDRKKAMQLMDSLVKGYPTGSLLIWRTSNPPPVKNDAIDPDQRVLTDVILDGQQRLTTLYMLIKNEVPPYYLASEIAHDPRSMHFDLETRSFSYPTMRDRATRPTLVPVVKCLAGEINVFELPGSAFGNGDPEQKNSRLNVFNESLMALSAIRNTNYPIQTVPQTASLNEAINVFDRVNSSGIRLTDADLALAYISGVWADARRVLKAKQSELKERGFSFDLQFFARCLAVTSKRRADYSALRSAKSTELEHGWARLSPMLDYLTAVLERIDVYSSKDMGTSNTLVPAIAFLSNNDGRFPSGQSVNHFLGWFLMATIARRYSGGETNQKISHDVSIAFEHRTPWKPLLDALEEDRGRLIVAASDLEGLDQKNPLFKVIISMYRHRKSVDWFNGVPLSSARNGSLELHVHHIYPKGFLNTIGYKTENVRQRLLINEVANLALLTRPSNLEISDESPARYLPQVSKDFADALASQLVPDIGDFDYETSGFEEFLELRRQRIAASLNNYIGTLLEGVGASSTNESITNLVELGRTASIEEYDSIFTGNCSDNSVADGWDELAGACAAFLNSEGGRILIGVKEHEVVGMEDDLSQLNLQSAETFRELCKQQLEKRLGAEAVNDLSFIIDVVDGRNLMLIKVPAASRPTFVQRPGYHELPVRDGLEIKVLSEEDQIQDYMADRWEV